MSMVPTSVHGKKMIIKVMTVYMLVKVSAGPEET